MNKPVALITGASSGIGETFARKLAARGYDLILVARREDKMRALAATLSASCEIIAADLATDDGLATVEHAIRNCPRLDLLVNNAGFGSLKRFWEADLSGQDQMHRLHVIATMRLCRAALEGMVAANRGSIINVSSVASFGQMEGSVSYCATKAWMTSFTRGLAMELDGIKSNVQVQALCPGFTYSEFHDRLGVDRKATPGFLWMKAEDVVETSLQSLEQRKVIVIPGMIYKIGVAVVKLLPSGFLLLLRRMRKDKRV